MHTRLDRPGRRGGPSRYPFAADVVATTRLPRWDPRHDVPQDTLTEFTQVQSRVNEWLPEKHERTIYGGSPPPRRRSTRPSPLSHEATKTSFTSMSLTNASAPMSPEVRVPENPVITLTDSQLRKAFGPSPIFGSSGLEPMEMMPRDNSPFPTSGPNPPSPKEDASFDDDAELESFKSLSIEELLSVFRGSPITVKDDTRDRVVAPTSPPWSSC